MRARRLLSCLLAAVWLSPAALSGALALHVVIDHAHHDSAEHGRSAGQRVAVADALEHGHAHREGEAEHRHFSLPAAAVVARAATAASTPEPGSSPPAGVPTGAPEPGARAMGRSGTSPPGTSGPPLLALLSVLRI